MEIQAENICMFWQSICKKIHQLDDKNISVSLNYSIYPVRGPVEILAKKKKM